MALILRTIWEGYQKVFNEYAHPGTRDWYLSSEILHVMFLSTYLYFCLNLGPRFMKNQKPYKLKGIMLCYNIVQICLSAFVFYEAGIHGWFSRYNYYCEPIAYHPREKRILELVWLYYVCKISELLDTVFFILRKKESQVSGLHLYHHSLMLFAAWMSLKYMPGGHGSFLGWLNSFVHVIMYSYYLISGLGPQFQKYLWWKKYITILQLVQFVLIFIHNFVVFFYECDYPRIVNFLCCLDALIFLYMFGKFYYCSYVKDKKK